MRLTMAPLIGRGYQKPFFSFALGRQIRQITGPTHFAGGRRALAPPKLKPHWAVPTAGSRCRAPGRPRSVSTLLLLMPRRAADSRDRLSELVQCIKKLHGPDVLSSTWKFLEDSDNCDRIDMTAPEITELHTYCQPLVLGYQS